jgi:hypothetical protein
MKNKVEELNVIILDLRKTISSLEDRVAKEESDKLVSFLVIAFCMKRLYMLFSTSHFYCGLLTRMQLSVIEKKKKQELLVKSCKLLFQRSLKKFGRRNQLLNKR